ncbi:GtrA family protein [Oscillospiraceae bacterium CM]|nr:GtrA family protein [Oscillospiraceae bacterium CM]
MKPLFFEVFRYLLVGGASTLIDFATLYLFNNTLPDLHGYRLYIAAALGFLAGLVFNYVLSLAFVFQTAKTKGAGRGAAAFMLFAVIGGTGLGLTELGMYIGVALFMWHYLFVKILVTGIVFFWNYLSRKILIFR